MKPMSTKAGSLPFADKQTGMVLITNCVWNFCHARTASGTWECL